MTHIPRQANIRWRKSSYSTNNDGNCVECATLGAAAWRKSSYSTNENGSCVEIATLPAAIAIRDSKNPGGPHLAVPAEAFAAFVREITPAV